MAYHWLAISQYSHGVYQGSDKEEAALISSLKPLGRSLVEPAVFLSGITGLRFQSEDDRNH